MRKSVSKRKGRAFLAGGIGRYGPYAVGTYRVAPGLYVKGSIGTRGTRLALKKTGRSGAVEFGHNLTTKLPYVKATAKRRRS